MKNSLPRLLFITAGGTFIIVIGAMGIPAHAQVSPEITNCAELQDQSTLALMESCGDHIGCNMILSLQNTCAKAKGFLSTLNETLSGRREITNNDVFEANSPTLTSSEALKNNVAVVQKILRDANAETTKEKLTYKNKSGKDSYYEGGLKDENRHGVGVFITSSGFMGRGQMKNNKIQGKAQTVSPDGNIITGDHVNTYPLGNVAYQSPKGTVSAGYYLGDNKWSGVIVVTRRNGDHYKELYDNEGKMLASGPVAKAGQVAITPTAPGSTAAPPSQHDSSTPGSPDYQPVRRPVPAASGSANSTQPGGIGAGYDPRAARGGSKP